MLGLVDAAAQLGQLLGGGAGHAAESRFVVVSGPPEALRRSLLEGPSRVTGIDWHDAIASTNTVALEAAARGEPEILLVGAEAQTAGRGRLGRVWEAPPGTSLTVSFLLRPAVAPARWPTLALAAGVALADVAARWCPDAAVGLKWPNDLLLDGVKTAGILVEAVAGACVAGIGLNVDWRGLDRGGLAATSLAEAAGVPVDRWRVLAGLAGVLDRTYQAWTDDPSAVVDRYRSRCVTIGNAVAVQRVGQHDLQGVAVAVGDDGALAVRTADGRTVAVLAGDVHHVRPPASPEPPP